MMKKNILQISSYLDELILNPICELNYNKDYELLIAVMLSANTTDKMVNKVTSVLFLKYKSLDDYKNSNIEDIKNIIRPIGSYNKKSLYIKEIANILIKNYNYVIPNTIEELIKLPGVGRKCASVILAELYNIPAFAVDTHVIRISNRLGLVNTKDPVKIEKSLKKIFKQDEWNKRHRQLVLFGRYYCMAKKPNCKNCKLQNICNNYKY